ncbi:MAG: hypothetical protein AAFV19_11780 [Pseudomonadota bacterium]
MHRVQGFIIGLVSAIGLSAPAASADMRALIVDLAGTVDPAVDLFDELVIGTELTLGANTELTLSHYGACNEIVIKGGSVIIGKKDIKIVGGRELSRVQVDCPEQVALVQTDTTNASVIMRNFARIPSVPLAPQIVVNSAPGTDVNRLTILRDETEIADLPVKNGMVRWPDGGLYLSDNTKYTLVVRGRGVDHRAVVVASRDASGRVVLRP